MVKKWLKKLSLTIHFWKEFRTTKIIEKSNSSVTHVNQTVPIGHRSYSYWNFKVSTLLSCYTCLIIIMNFRLKNWVMCIFAVQDQIAAQAGMETDNDAPSHWIQNTHSIIIHYLRDKRLACKESTRWYKWNCTKMIDAIFHHFVVDIFNLIGLLGGLSREASHGWHNTLNDVRFGIKKIMR